VWVWWNQEPAAAGQPSASSRGTSLYPPSIVPAPLLLPQAGLYSSLWAAQCATWHSRLCSRRWHSGLPTITLTSLRSRTDFTFVPPIAIRYWQQQIPQLRLYGVASAQRSTSAGVEVAEGFFFGGGELQAQVVGTGRLELGPQHLHKGRVGWQAGRED
jgi:hypothetical protein